MKAKAAGLLVAILLVSTQCIIAQRQITVQAENNDISNNLDLKAVATAFGESKNLEDFERRLNDYDSAITNLDLNNDGQVDYLRVIEKYDNGVHVVVIQAVLDRDVYQDVATIVVDRDQYNNNTTVQVIGDPYIYGPNYIIEPAYIYTPSIFSFLWGSNYYAWYSPYHWGYYPTYYHHRSPFEINIYLSNVYRHVNHQQRYYYSNSIRNQSALNVRSSISRNDYGTRYPDRNFTNRNENVRNKRDLEFTRNGVMRNTPTRTSTDYNKASGMSNSNRMYDNAGNRNSQSNERNQQNSNSVRENSYQNRSNTNESVNRNNGWQNTNRNQNTYTQPANSPLSNNRNSEGNNNVRNNMYQQRQNSDNETTTGSSNRYSPQPRQNDNNVNNRISNQVAPQRTQPQPQAAPRTVTAPAVREQRQAAQPRSASNEKSDSRR